MTVKTRAYPSKHETAKCSSCSSTELLFDAYVGWDNETQQFTVVSVKDGGKCLECGGKPEWTTQDDK